MGFDVMDTSNQLTIRLCVEKAPLSGEWRDPEQGLEMVKGRLDVFRGRLRNMSRRVNSHGLHFFTPNKKKALID